MRETSSWCKSLVQRLRAELGETARVRRFLHVELAMYLLEKVAPNESVDAVPALLSGYPFLRRDGQALANARIVLAAQKNPYSWEAAVQEYLAQPESLRGYGLRQSRVERLDVSVAANRFDTYERTLAKPLPYQKRNSEVAGPGTWLLKSRAGTSSVTIPPDLVGLAASSAVQRDVVPQRKTVRPVVVAWDELTSTAQWMDAADATFNRTRNWLGRIEKVRLELFNDTTEAFEPAQKLTVNRLLHMVGMVSAGKSTLMDVLAVWCARRRLRITLVVGDVVSAVRRTTMFRSFGLSAAPILGRSNRRRHAERLHRLLATEGCTSPLEMQDPAFDFLSTACAVDGLREHARPFEIGDHPCEAFFKQSSSEETNGEEGPYLCPFSATCQQHKAAREVSDAAIWVTTPAALVYSELPTSLSRERMRYVESLYKTQDLVIVDEVDQVQVQLDMMFSPHESLFGGSQSSWFDELEDRVGRELRSSRRRPLGDADVSRWVNALDVASAAGNRVYSLLHQNTGLRKWLGRAHFTEWTLANRLALELSGCSDSDQPTELTVRFKEAFRNFNEAPLGEAGLAPSELVTLTLQCLSAADDAQVSETIRGWIRTNAGKAFDEGRSHEGATRLEFMLLIAVLSNRLEVLIRMWRQVELQMRLDGNSVLFHRPPEDYRQVIPDSPMGNILGFQYLTSADGRDPAGELRFFRCMGVGRWVLLHLHELFDADGTQGPNVLMLSGTSWAGAAPGYHVQVPVGAILRAPPSEVEAVARTTFRFAPQYDPTKGNAVIRVSGAKDPEARRTAIRAILKQLAAPSRFGGRKSQLEREVESLPVGRRRALMLVGSYADARRALEDLIEIQPSWRDRVACLIPDDDDEGADAEYLMLLRRGDVEKFGRGAADILIAPLLAVERGHNILNEEQRAAVGVLYMLVRPMPRPDDMSFAVLATNRRAVEESKTLSDRANIESISSVGKDFRHDSFLRWRDVVGASMSWASLDDATRAAVTWNQLVSLWQVIGRLVRGGQSARVILVDGAFMPDSSRDTEKGDTSRTSLVLAMQEVLSPYLSERNQISPRDRAVAQALYGPLKTALDNMLGELK